MSTPTQAKISGLATDLRIAATYLQGSGKERAQGLADALHFLRECRPEEVSQDLVTAALWLADSAPGSER